MRKEISKLPEKEADRVLELPNSYREEGRQEGKEEGINQGKKMVVQNMIKNGMSDHLIADMAGFDVKTVKELRKRLNDSSEL